MNLLESLSAAIGILENHGCEHWLMAGTCLGAIRDQRFLNYDIDLGIFSDRLYLWDQFIKDFQARGFELFMEWKDKERKIELAFQLEDGGIKIKVDLFFYFIDGVYCWHGLFGPDGQGRWGDYKVFYPCIFRKELFLNPREVKFKGIKCFVPNPPEEYLESWYGKTWKIPTRNWLSWRDSKAINFEIFKELSNEF